MFKSKKIIAIILTVCLLVTLSPIQVFAQFNQDTSTVENMENAVDNNSQKPKIVGEVIEKREKNAKHFFRDDTSFEAAIYPVAVHYEEDGKWKDIDNTLIDKVDEENNEIFENNHNSYKVKIAKTSNSNKTVRISKDKYEVSWTILDANKSMAQRVEKVSAPDSSFDEKEILKNLQSVVNFSEIFTGIDFEYKVLPEEVKENIIIKEKVDKTEFKFNLGMKNLIPRIEKNGTIVFYDINENSKPVMVVKKPFMYDAKGETSYDVAMTLVEVKGGYELTLSPDKAWINDESRQFPITIDPVIGTTLERDKIFDAHVSSGVPNTNFWQSTMLKTGYGTSSGVNRTYISFTLPTNLTAADLITDAYLNLSLYSGVSSDRQINVHKVLGSWSSDSITWNNKPAYNTQKIEEYQIVNGAQYSDVKWNITGIVKDWHSSGTNYGLMLKSSDESSDYTDFYSSDTSDAYAGYRPQVVMSYVNNSGLEGYWGYHSQSVERAGTGYVNDYNGNMVFVHNDLSMNGNRMPVTLNHVFNSNDKSSNIGYGYGWRLNLSQRIEPKTIGETQYYAYSDGDGTTHYLLYDSTKGKIVDESGLDLSMTINTSSTNEKYTITDKGGNRLIFTSSGYLYKITDLNGNTMTLSYGGATLKTITDGAGRITTLDVNQYGFLVGIIDPSGRRTSFGYSGAQLTTITYPDGKSTIYSSDSQNNLLTATNFNGYKMTYTYYKVAPYRVSSVLESNTDGTLGGSLSISYGYNSTTFTDVSGRKNVYQFNDWGNTVSVKDPSGYAQYAKYLTSGTNKNKLSLDSKLQKTVTNYLKNHNAEVQSDWLTWNSYSSTGTFGYDTSVKYIGNQSLRINKTNDISRSIYYQTITLEKGKTYTFSGYIKTAGVTNLKGKGACLLVSYTDGSGVGKVVESRFASGNSDWERYEVKFTLPANATSADVEIRATITDETGTAYFDALQLEEGSIANRYNLVENADLRYGSGTPSFWIKNTACDTSDTLITSTDSSYPAGLDKNTFKIIGSATKTKNISQKINVTGSTGDAFVLAGWAKADSVHLSSGRYLALDLCINYSDNTQKWIPVQFNEDSSDWQYLSEVAIADKAYTSIVLYALYYNNVNTAYFDGFQLYKEEFGQSYQYDEKSGNLLSTTDLAKQNSAFKYDNNNDLVKYTNPKGSEFNYKYTEDGKRNLETATSAENVVYSFQYDSYGNPKKAKVSGGTLFIESNSDYTDNGNYIKTITDSSGNTVTNDYDQTKGTLSSVADPEGKLTSYSYDNLDRLTDVYKTVDGQIVKNSYYYENDRIKNITHNGFNYNFGYDSLGNNTTVSVGSQNLITNTYEARTGKLLESTYGNGQKVSSDYDSLDRVTADKINGEVRYGYGYDASGNLGYQEDLVNGVNYRYIYDLSNRLTEIRDSKDNKSSYYFDTDNNLQLFKERVDGKSYSTRYSYDRDNKPVSVVYSKDTTGVYSNLEDSMIAYYSFDNNDISDISGNGNTGTTIGGVQFVDGYMGKALKLNGIDSYAELTDFKIPNTFTVSVWVKPEDLVKNQSVIGKHTADGSNIFLFGLWNQKYDTEVRSGYYNNVPFTSSGEFQHIVIVVKEVSSTQSKITAYRDNALLYEATVNGVIGDSSGKKWVVGQEWDGTSTSDFFKGSIDELSFYNRELTASEISALFNIKSNISVINNSYDSIARLKSSSIVAGNLTFNTSYMYEPGIDGNTTTKVQSINNDGKEISYTHDKNGNIKTIIEDGNPDTKIEYFYNELNELVRENNKVLGKTVTYSYDAGGNILEKKIYGYTTAVDFSDLSSEVVSYVYSDANWKDKLKFYNKKEVAYDDIGNPLTYDGWQFTWEKGRQLKTIGNGTTNLTFKYNSSGIRTEKEVNGVVTKYHLVGDKVTLETDGSNTIYYSYDSTGHLVSMNLNGVEYYYVRNAQGDIIGLLDNNGTQVAAYTYDSWGKLISIKDQNGTDVTNDINHVGYKNPYRYRGYRYDTETGLYYLNSRYYNPEWGRFINADAITGETGTLLSHNMFAYCMNNPVNMDDPSGYMPNWLKVTIGAVAVVAAVTITVATGGAAAPLLIGVAASTITSAAVGYATGGKQGMIDGAADGFMWGGIGALGSSAVGAIKAVNAAKKGVTIGRNMDKVRIAATVSDTGVYKPLNKTVYKTLGKISPKLADDVSYLHNKAFIKRMVKLGAPIYDSGLNGATSAGRWYGMELDIVKGYFNYVKMY